MTSVAWSPHGPSRWTGSRARCPAPSPPSDPLTEHPPPDPTRRDDPLRRIALITLTVLVPVVVALVVLVRVLGGNGTSDGRVAQVSGTPSPQREDLPPLPVDVPPGTPAADASCPALMSRPPLHPTR